MVEKVIGLEDVRLIHCPASRDNRKFIIEAGADGAPITRAALLELGEAMVHAALDFPVEETTCRGCDAPMQWIKTEQGKAAPCDTNKVTIVTPGGKYQVGFTPHFATCPKADDFRQKVIVCQR